MDDAKFALPQRIKTIIGKHVAEYTEWSGRRLQAEQNAWAIKSTRYHFTGFGGLRGILDSSNIRLTHYSFQNDPSEFIHGTRIAKSCIADLAKEADFGPVHDLSTCIIDLLGNPSNADLWTAYVACFTQSVNDIGLWRTYGRDGQGCAIGFSKDMFEIDRTELHPIQERIWVGKVDYPAKRLPPRFRDPMAVIARKLIDAAVEIGDSVAGDHVITWAIVREFANQVIAQPIIWNALTTKHPGYRSERETRLVMIGLKGEYDSLAQLNERRTPFVPYAFDRAVAVASIVLGPDSPDGAIDAVKEFLTRIGLSHVPVVRSSLPYRSLETERTTIEDVRRFLG